ncbi:MAG: phytanoyl-CoA dioxygenase family protein [Pseudomonadota bacterium]
MTEMQTAFAHTDCDNTLLPTESEVISYEASGWYKSRQIIPHDLLDEVHLAIMDHQLGKRDRSLAGPAKFSDWKPGDGDGVRNNEFCSLQNDTVQKLVALPILGAIAARLARSPEIRLFDDQAVYKPPAGIGNNVTAIGWHTDHSCWSTCTSHRMLTAWIPLDDVTLWTGTLCLIDGSHKWPESEDMRGFNNPNLNAIEDHIGREIPNQLITSMALRKGEVSFHHMRTLHCSSPNRSDTPRLALAIHMQDGDNTSRPFITPSGARVVLPHDNLCRKNADGNPDYTDPTVFPRLWPPREWGRRNG